MRFLKDYSISLMSPKAIIIASSEILKVFDYERNKRSTILQGDYN